MAGKPKKRIDYAGWSVDIFSSDTKIDKLLDSQGWVGFGVYFYLCQMAFASEGYYYEWCYDLCATTARKMGGGVSAGTVKETVKYCLQIGLFDKGLFDRWGILTSRGIQKSFLVVLKSKNRRGTEIFEEFWLLDRNEDDYRNIIPKRKDDSLRANEHLLEENEHLLKQKESKEENRKEKGNIGELAFASFDAEKAWDDTFDLYPKKTSASVAKQFWLDKLLDVIECNRADMAQLIYLATKMYIEDYKKRSPDDTNFKYVPKYCDWLKNDCDYWIREVEKMQKSKGGVQ